MNNYCQRKYDGYHVCGNHEMGQDKPMQCTTCKLKDFADKPIDQSEKMYLLLGECLMSLHHNPELQDKIAAVRKDVRGN